MSTSIDDLLKGASGGTDMSEVDSILQELESKKPPPSPKQLQPPPPQQVPSQPDPQIIAQLQAQQQQLQQLSMMNREKDLVIQKLQSSDNLDNSDSSVDKSVDLLTEFKPTIILFSLVLILTLPVLNKFICKSIGIEENTVFSILRTFIISIIFFLINKFV